MANDRKKDSGSNKPSGKDSASSKRPIGRGMDSLDSTQAPLKASDGEPDYDAMTDKGKKAKSKSDLLDKH